MHGEFDLPRHSRRRRRGEPLEKNNKIHPEVRRRIRKNITFMVSLTCLDIAEGRRRGEPLEKND